MEEDTFFFSSAPVTPRERTPDILVRFQAVTSELPCLEARTVFISSQCTLIEVRRHIQRHFQCLYERGFIFLRQHREVSRSQERAVRLFDVMPKVRLGQPRDAFLFPGIQYKKVAVEKEGRRDFVMCAGVVFICEANSENVWPQSALRQELSGNTIFADSFAFIPAFITSASQEALNLHVDEMNHLASRGDQCKLQAILSELPSNVTSKQLKDQRLATPLHYAAQNGHVEVCEALIGRFGHDILYIKDCNQRMPLHCALHAKKLDVVCYLLHLSPDLEWHDNSGFSCARMLHGLNTWETGKLVSHLEPQVLDPQLVLHLTVFAITTRNIRQALRYCRYAPIVQAPFYRPPLHLAAELGNLDIIKALLSEDKVRQLPYRRKSTVTSEAPEEMNTSFEASLALGTSTPTQTPRSTPNLPPSVLDRKLSREISATDDATDGSPMKNVPKPKRRKSKMKVRVHEPDIVSELDVLLEEVVDTRHSPKMRDSDGHLPFHYACQHGHHACLGLLYFNDMSPADFLKGVRLALNWKRFQVLQTLSVLRTEYTLDGETLSSIIKESERDICMVGHSLLPVLRPHTHHLTRLLPHAASIGAGDVVQTLLKMQVKPDTADYMGRTPLHEACQQNRVHVVGVLLNEAGADPNVRDWRGSTPLHYACAAGHLEVVEMLMKNANTIADCADVLGRTPLLTAAHCNQQQLLSTLVKRHLPKLSPLHTDVEGRSMLHYLTNVPAEVMKGLIQGVKDKKDKAKTQQSQSAFSPPSYNSAQEAELREMWTDPEYVNNQSNVATKLARKAFSKRQRQMMTIACQRCGKSFSCTQRTKFWYHVCIKHGVQNGVPSSTSTKTPGSSLVRTPTFLPGGTNELVQDSHITRHVQSFPVLRQPTNIQCELSPLDVAVIHNKNDVMKEIVKAFPALAKRQSTAVLAARMANSEALKILYKSSSFSKDVLTHLLHIACIQRPADRTTTEHFLNCIKVLLKLGAHPNYIPNPAEFEADRLSTSEQSLVPFTALEVAAIVDDMELAEVLLENGASASICFAVHLSALKGNVLMLQMLLPQWKEGRWKPYVRGFDGDINELVRVCTLESGLVQALCASEKVCMELLKVALEEEKDLLVAKKILTHHMVHAVRPHVCKLKHPTLMNKFLYKNADDLTEHDHICQHLPLSSLLRCPERIANRKQVETMAVYLLQQGAHLSEMRVSRKSQVHVACEVFVLGVKRRMWKLVEVLLMKAGTDIWQCLLERSHTCHKYVYRRWTDDHFIKRRRKNEWSGGQNGFLCLSKGMLRIFRLLPLNLLRQFLNKGKAAMKKNVVEGLRTFIVPPEVNDGTGSSRSRKPSKQLSPPPNAVMPTDSLSPPPVPTPRRSLTVPATPMPHRRLSTPDHEFLKARSTSPFPTLDATSPLSNSAASPMPNRKGSFSKPRAASQSRRSSIASHCPVLQTTSPIPKSDAASPTPHSPVSKSSLMSPSPRASIVSLTQRPDAISPFPKFSDASPTPNSGIDTPRGRSRHTGTFHAGIEKDGQAQLLLHLLAYQVRQAEGTRGHLMVLSKLTVLCPTLLSITMPIIRFHQSRRNWLPHVPRQAMASALKKQKNAKRVIQSLMSEMMEVSLWMKLSTLSHHQVKTVEEQGLTLLHLACLLGDTRMIKALLSVVVFPLPPDVRSRSGLTAIEIAASQGSARMMDVLVKRGARAPRSILVATCVGRAYANFHPEKDDLTKLPGETTKLYIIQWCAKNFSKSVDLAYYHPKHGTVFDIIMRKHHWAIFDWLLNNTEVGPVSKLLARCKDMAELAEAPEQLIGKVLKSLGEVLLALPEHIMQKFLLVLTLRSDSVLERVVRRLMSLDYFYSQERLLAMVTARGKHNETIMHNMCRMGHMASLKLFLCLFSVNITKNAQISDFLDVVDSSGCTPLWYCLALKRWTMAEYLITSGIRVSPKRAVPDLCTQRCFTQCRGSNPICDIGDASVMDRPRRKSSPKVSNNSTQIVQLLSPDCDELLKVYQSTPEQSPVQEDGETKAQQGPALSDSGYSVSEGDAASESDEDKKRNLRYLLSLVHYSTLKGATLIHAAAAVGDKDLLEGLAQSPYSSAQLAFSRTFSPFVYALANGRTDTVMACLQHGLGPYEEDPVCYTLARAIMAHCAVQDSEMALHRLLAHQKVSPDTEEAVMNMVSTRSPSSSKIRHICTHISATDLTCSESDLVQLVHEVVNSHRGVVNETLLVAAAITGKLWVFRAILDSVENKNKVAEQCTRLIIPKAAFIDLLFLFAPRRNTKETYAPEYSDRMKILHCIASEANLALQPQTLRAAIKKNLLPMLEVVIKEHIRNDLPLQPSTLWFESMFKGSVIGDFHYVNTLCGANLNVKMNVLQTALLRALCLACLHRHKQIVNRLLLFKLPLLTVVPDLPKAFYLQPQLVLESAIEGGDSVVASLILQTMEETGLHPSQEDILRSIFMAFRKGMEPIIDNLLMFAHYVAPDLVSMNICRRLFLVAARSGHGRICSKFLNLEKLNVSARDPHGFTALHYACMYNRLSLVRVIVAVSPDSVRSVTPDGLTPLDLARCMGNWELAFELIASYGAARGEGFDDKEMLVRGWMKRLLALNEQCEENSPELMKTGPLERDMSIQNLIRRGDDRAARILLEVAQESMVSCMLEDYTNYPLVHLCASYGCETSLLLLLKLVDAQPELETKILLEHEFKGMIPLALAIRGGHVACVRHLIGTHYPTEWRLKGTDESILHIAAKVGNEEIIQLVTERATNDFMQSQDIDGLIPATTAIAYGHHQIVSPLLRGLRFAEKLHHEHLTTTYWCVLCLLDLCIGWSKAFQERRTMTLNRKGRNVFQRHRTEAGFTLCSDVGARAVLGRVLDSPEGRTCLLKWLAPASKKAPERRKVLPPRLDLSLFYTQGLGSRHNLSHTLDTLQSWIHAGASPEILDSALGTMQYASRDHRSELFLLLSRMTRFEAVDYIIRKRQDGLATYLYSKLHPAFDSEQKQNFFHNACAQGLTSLVHAIIAADPEFNFLTGKQNSAATPLDLALAFGQSDTAEILLQKLEGQTIGNAVSELRALTPYLSIMTQWKLGMAEIGDSAWKASIDFSLCRLSHLDLYLITHPTDNCFPGSLMPRDILGPSVCGKELDLDHQSMQQCVSELGVNDTWLTAHVLSRAVLGKFHTEINPDAEDWQMLDKISLRCIPVTSDETAKTIIQGHTLYDVIKVAKHKGEDGSACFSVDMGNLPLSLTTSCLVRQRLFGDVLPEFKRRLAVMHGLAFDVTIDWNSIESLPDLRLQRHLISILAGENGSSHIAGLAQVMDTCVNMLQDMETLINLKSTQAVKRAIADTKTIVVKFVENLPMVRGLMDLQLDSRVMWYFSVDNDWGLVYNRNLFPVYVFTTVAHTLFTCTAHSLRRFPDPQPALRSVFTPDPESRSQTTDTAHSESDRRRSVASAVKSTVGTNVSESGGTAALSDITGDAAWNSDSLAEDISRLATSSDEAKVPGSPVSKSEKHSIQLVEVENDSGVMLDIAWDHFAFLPEVKNLLHFIRTYLSRELDRVSDGYAAIQPLDLDITKVAIRVVFGQEGAGLTLDKNTLTITLHCFCEVDGKWEAGIIDPENFFSEKKIQSLCKRWRTGSIKACSSFDRSTRQLTRALGFPVALPVTSQATLELLCRAEGRQMTPPYELLKTFLKSLSRHITEGYLQAVTTALCFSGHCWLLGHADIPSSMWCWVRLSDVARRKPGERYLVLSHTEHGKAEFYMVKGSEVLDAAPGQYTGIWHKHDQGLDGNISVMLKEVITDRVQLITINTHVFLTAQSRATSKFMSSLPLAIEIGTMSESPLTKALWFDEVFLRSFELGKVTEVLATTNPSTLSVMECWQMASSLGFHLVFDLLDLTKEDPVFREKKLLMASSVMLETLRDVTDVGLYGIEMVEIMKKLLKTMGTIIVSHKPVDRALHIVRGGMYEEEVVVHLLTERDVQFSPQSSLWDRPEDFPWPKPFVESLCTTLCATFSLQTRSELSRLLRKKLSRTISTDDISFIQFAERSDKLVTLVMAHEAVTGFVAALTHFVERYISGMRKLKSELTSVMFIEEAAADPVVMLQSGVLKVGLFKSGVSVEQRTYLSDLLTALAVDEDIDEADMVPQVQVTPRVKLLQRLRREEVLTGISSASSARRRGPRVRHIVKTASSNKYTVERAIQRLLTAAEAGKTGDLMDSLDIGAPVNSVNENDETPLILAAKGRNYIIQELLLGRGANVNMADQGGMTALHYEAGHGDAEAVKLLLSNGAEPNTTDMMGRTPLHYSVNNAHIDATDALVFCGADASIVNKEDWTPAALCQTRGQKAMMRTSDFTVRGLATGNIFVEHLVLEADTTYTLESVGISLRTPLNLGQIKTRLMMRRVIAEYSTCGLLPTGKEMLLSDVYELRISGARLEGTVALRVPVHSRPSDYDDVFVKTDIGVYSSPLRAMKQGNDQWVCHVRIFLNDVKAFILVARPRIEPFTVTPAGGDFTSSLNSLLRISVLQNTFQANEELALEVMISPTFEEEEFDNVMSLSHFYSLTSVSKKQQKPANELIISLPLPDNFFNEGELFVLLRRPKDTGKAVPKEQWDVISKNPDVSEGMVKFRAPGLGLFCLLEKAIPTTQTNRLSADVSAARYISRLHRKADRGEHDVVVFALARAIGGVGGLVKREADVVVEVVLSYRLHSRLEYWKARGFVDRKPCFSNVFSAQPVQEFLVQVGGCCQDADVHLSSLYFHPRRDNAMVFSVSERLLATGTDSWIDVFTSSVAEQQRAMSRMTSVSATTANSSKMDSFVERRSNNHVGKLMLKVPWPRTEEQLEEERLIKFAALSPFTEDQNTGILESVAWGLGADWMKVAILLGTASATVSRLAHTSSLNEGQRAMQMLEQWRNTRAPRQDRGVAELLVTLQKAGREDLVNVALNRLRNWLSEHGVTGGPMAAMLLNKNLATPRKEGSLDLDADNDIPDPMSVEFLRCLCQRTGPRFDIAPDLGISKPELDNIMADPLVISDEDKMFKVLLLSRDKQQKTEDGLRTLLRVTRDRELSAAFDWMLLTTQRWMVFHGATDDQFAHAVGEILSDFSYAS